MEDLWDQGVGDFCRIFRKKISPNGAEEIKEYTGDALRKVKIKQKHLNTLWKQILTVEYLEGF